MKIVKVNSVIIISLIMLLVVSILPSQRLHISAEEKSIFVDQEINPSKIILENDTEISKIYLNDNEIENIESINFETLNEGSYTLKVVYMSDTNQSEDLVHFIISPVDLNLRISDNTLLIKYILNLVSEKNLQMLITTENSNKEKIILYEGSLIDKYKLVESMLKTESQNINVQITDKVTQKTLAEKTVRLNNEDQLILDVDEVIESNFEKDANIKRQEVGKTKNLYTFDPAEWEIEKYENEWVLRQYINKNSTDPVVYIPGYVDIDGGKRIIIDSMYMLVRSFPRIKKELIITDLGNVDWKVKLRSSSLRFAFNSRNFTKIDLSGLDTSKVTDMSEMFSRLTQLTELELGARFDTSSVTNMSGMFSGLTNLTELELGARFDTSSVTNMSGMFSGLTNLTELELGTDFDTSKVTDMSEMFSRLTQLTELELGARFDTSSVTNMLGMFSGLKNLTELNLGDHFNTSNVTNMSFMFSNLNKMKSLSLGDRFDTSKVIDMNGMFRADDYKNHSELKFLSLGKSFDTSNVINMNDMFRGQNGLIRLDLGKKFDTSSVTNMSGMFSGLTNLTELELGARFDTSSVEEMVRIFAGLENLSVIDLGELFNLQQNPTMFKMFRVVKEKPLAIIHPHPEIFDKYDFEYDRIIPHPGIIKDAAEGSFLDGSTLKAYNDMIFFKNKDDLKISADDYKKFMDEAPVSNKTNEKFIGWSPEFIEQIREGNILDDKKYTANYQAPVKVNFIVSGMESTVLVEYGDHIDEADIPMTAMPGFKFIGWYLNPEGSGNPVDLKDYKVLQAVTLYAIYDMKIEISAQNFAIAYDDLDNDRLIKEYANIQAYKVYRDHSKVAFDLDEIEISTKPSGITTTGEKTVFKIKTPEYSNYSDEVLGYVFNEVIDEELESGEIYQIGWLGHDVIIKESELSNADYMDLSEVKAFGINQDGVYKLMVKMVTEKPKKSGIYDLAFEIEGGHTQYHVKDYVFKDIVESEDHQEQYAISADDFIIGLDDIYDNEKLKAAAKVEAYRINSSGIVSSLKQSEVEIKTYPQTINVGQGELVTFSVYGAQASVKALVFNDVITDIKDQSIWAMTADPIKAEEAQVTNPQLIKEMANVKVFRIENDEVSELTSKYLDFVTISKNFLTTNDKSVIFTLNLNDSNLRDSSKLVTSVDVSIAPSTLNIIGRDIMLSIEDAQNATKEFLLEEIKAAATDSLDQNLEVLIDEKDLRKLRMISMPNVNGFDMDINAITPYAKVNKTIKVYVYDSVTKVIENNGDDYYVGWLGNDFEIKKSELEKIDLVAAGNVVAFKLKAGVFEELEVEFNAYKQIETDSYSLTYKIIETDLSYCLNMKVLDDQSNGSLNPSAPVLPVVPEKPGQDVEIENTNNPENIVDSQDFVTDHMLKPSVEPSEPLKPQSIGKRPNTSVRASYLSFASLLVLSLILLNKQKKIHNK